MEHIVDPVADMIAIIKNGYLAKKEQVSIPYSKFKLEIVKAIEKENFVGAVGKNQNLITVGLIYEDGNSKLTQIKKISKLGRRYYTKSKHIKPIKGGRGSTIITTPEGVMSEKEAKKKNLGGEVICQIW